MKKSVNFINSNHNGMNRVRVWIFGTILLLALIIISIYACTEPVTAQREGARMKLVQSIQIEKGDTLWSIAKEYITEEYDNIHEYVQELKNSNGLVSDKIRAGNYIIVPYYTDSTNVYAKY